MVQRQKVEVHCFAGMETLLRLPLSRIRSMHVLDISMHNLNIRKPAALGQNDRKL